MSEIDIKLLPLQGVTNERALTQGVASLALGYALIGLSARPLSVAPHAWFTRTTTPNGVTHYNYS